MLMGLCRQVGHTTNLFLFCKGGRNQATYGTVVGKQLDQGKSNCKVFSSFKVEIKIINTFVPSLIVIVTCLNFNFIKTSSSPGI